MIPGPPRHALPMADATAPLKVGWSNAITRSSPSSALTSVPVRCPGAGWTTSPALWASSIRLPAAFRVLSGFLRHATSKSRLRFGSVRLTPTKRQVFCVSLFS